MSREEKKKTQELANVNLSVVFASPSPIITHIMTSNQERKDRRSLARSQHLLVFLKRCAANLLEESRRTHN